jgi:hypothetical protein
MKMNEKDYQAFRIYCQKLGLDTFAEVEKFQKAHHAKNNEELLEAMRKEVDGSCRS